jgi:hypothetical protein
MKKLIIPLLFIFAIGILAAVESEPSAIVGYVKYPCVQGLNFVALPMDQGYNLVSQVGNTYPDLIEAISYWDASTQSWVASVYYPELEMWDPDFDVVIGMPLMVSCLNNFNYYSIGDLPTINAQYSLIPGLNAIMIPLNKSNLTQASMVGTNIGTLEAVSEWIASTQSWNASVYYPELEMWDPDFDVVIGMPLMVSSLSSTIWPSGPRLIKSSNK